jgi:hypothetical protein
MKTTVRVTRLGDFSPMRDRLLWADLFLLQKLPTFLGYFFPHGKVCALTLTKMVGLHFGRFFSQTHLVALRG